MNHTSGLKGSVVVGVTNGQDTERLLDWSAEWAGSLGREVALVAAHGPHAYLDPSSLMNQLVDAARAHASDQLRLVQGRFELAHPGASVRGFTVHASSTAALSAAARDAYAVVVAAPDLAVPRHRYAQQLADRVRPDRNGVLIVVDPDHAGRPAPDAPVVLGESMHPRSRSAARFAFAHAAATGRMVLAVHCPVEVDDDDPEGSILAAHQRVQAHLEPVCRDYPQVPMAVQVPWPEGDGRPHARNTAAALQSAARGAALLVVGRHHGESVLDALPGWLGASTLPQRLVRHAPCPVALVS